MTFIGVPNLSDGSEKQQTEFMERMNPPVSHVLDDPLTVWGENRVLSNPTMVFVDSDGTKTTHTGGIDPMDLLERAKEMALS